MHKAYWYLARLGAIVSLAIMLWWIAAASGAGSRSDALARYHLQQSINKMYRHDQPGYLDYAAERQALREKIEAAKRELARCGGCASAKAELDKWQGVENQFQHVAGALAQGVGMPPAIAKALGISLPMTPPMTAKDLEQYKVVRREWIDQRPPFCRVAADAHLDCLRSYQAKHGLLSNLDAATGPGGTCYESRKLYNHCYAQDYEAFEREKKFQALRAAGTILPEYIEYPSPTIYYGHVRDDFVPPAPPADLVRAKLEEAQVKEVRYILFKKGAGLLGALVVTPFFWSDVAPKSQCFKRAATAEIERRECDDLSEMTWRLRSPILSCLYTRPGGTQENLHDFTMYWYDQRPKAAEAEHLLKRSHTHPVLVVGDPRTDCPATKAEADATKRRYDTQLASLRARVPQVPPDVVLPGSEWRKQQQDRYDAKRKETLTTALRTFPIEGHYATEARFEPEQFVHRMRCSIVKVSEQLQVHCEGTDRLKRPYKGAGVLGDAELVIDWEAFPRRSGRKIRLSYTVEGNLLSGLPEDRSFHHIMTRIDVPDGNPEAVKAYEAKDYPRARGLFWGSCQVGDGRSCFELGAMYDSGVGGYRNGAIARRHYQQACVHGFLKGCEMAEGSADRERATVSLPVCPLLFKDRSAAEGVLECRCPARQSRGPIYGTDIYTDDSSICNAAVHAGLVDPAVSGSVRVEGIPGIGSYKASGRHGVGSRSRGAWPRAFRFVPSTETGSTSESEAETAAPAGPPVPGAPSPSAGPAGSLTPSTASATATATAPDPRTPRERCALDAIAGTYKTTHGPLVCKPAGASLQCCYGSACERKVELALDETGDTLVGTWVYPNGTRGPVRFPVSPQCALQSGRWGTAGRSPDRVWGVAGR
jgi:hypothetical protein